jgi:hypothetical protein
MFYLMYEMSFPFLFYSFFLKRSSAREQKNLSASRHPALPAGTALTADCTDISHPLQAEIRVRLQAVCKAKAALMRANKKAGGWQTENPPVHWTGGLFCFVVLSLSYWVTAPRLSTSSPPPVDSAREQKNLEP